MIQNLKKKGIKVKAILLATVLMSFTAETSAASNKNECKEHYEKQIEEINKKLRKGYREPTGNNLKRKRRKYKELKSEC